jgi:polyvinyl alcohol dehydrogenase (cytochrome)
LAFAGCSAEEKAAPLAQGESGQAAHAEALYAANCATCHDGNVAGAPDRAALSALSPTAILEAMTNGVMKEQSASLDRIDRIVLSQYLGNEAAGADVRVTYCEG